MRLRLAVLLLSSLVAVSCGGGGSDDSEGLDLASTTTTVHVPGPAEIRICASSSAPTADAALVEPIGEPTAVEVLPGEPVYRGVLGQVDIDRLVVAPVAAPPGSCGDGVAPLTGLAVDDSAVATRPALLVKVDNTRAGRPQESLTEADLVYEEMIEGGFTRLAVVFHTNAPLMGPIRSGRTTDIALLGSLEEPVFAWSGANSVHAALLRDQSIVDLGAQTQGGYFRAPDRPGTYDLMVEAGTLLDAAEGRGEGAPPPAHFEYRVVPTDLPSTARPASTVTVSFPSVHAQWDWDESAAGWARTQGSSAHVDAQGRQVIVANVVVAEVAEVATGAIDSAGATVLEQQFLGSGRGWIFTDGHAVEVTWTKPTLRSVATWTTPDGVPVALTPGTTWVELAPAAATSFS